MTDQFPKLKLKLDEIQARFDKIITEFIERELIEDVELKITTANFTLRSPQSRAISALRGILVNLINDEGQLDAQLIQKKHISAAESLLKMNRSQELATQVLIAAIQTDESQVSEMAIKALGEIKSKNDNGVEQEALSLFVSRPYSKEECEAREMDHPCGFQTNIPVAT